jgi:hypothetical protein
MDEKKVSVNGKEMPATLGRAISAVFSSAPKIDGHSEICKALNARLPKEWPGEWKVEVKWGKYTQTSTIQGLRQGIAFGLSVQTFKEGKVSGNLADELEKEIATLK